MTHPDSRRPQVIDLSAPEHQDTDKENPPEHRTQDTDKENHQSSDERMLRKLLDYSFYVINLFPKFQIPYLHFFPFNSKSFPYTFSSLDKRQA